MIDHQEIPMHSKILVRVFFNGRQLLGPRVQNNARQYSEIEEFMVRFSETQPLFDFMDCGGGKERADSKIKGTCDCGSRPPQPHLVKLMSLRGLA